MEAVYHRQDLMAVVLLLTMAEEVEEVRYASKEGILKMIEEGTFVPCTGSYISYIFDLKELNGIRGALI